jgi:hypothetical protein
VREVRARVGLLAAVELHDRTTARPRPRSPNSWSARLTGPSDDSWLVAKSATLVPELEPERMQP